MTYVMNDVMFVLKKNKKTQQQIVQLDVDYSQKVEKALVTNHENVLKFSVFYNS